MIGSCGKAESGNSDDVPQFYSGSGICIGIITTRGKKATLLQCVQSNISSYIPERHQTYSFLLK